ncbi:hypothetical protein GIY62_14595 [Burkholderia plantarii]|uniref:hypothetical protein n=1 Tax=Burkholderia plantarii TaxID=41899 RepID=UPI00272C1FE4|nr:hypothetical protein [Burkholderia plantarii]WLE58355.1 hypothetical protein GIY62_14595 [Burkholderia plantarii]
MSNVIDLSKYGRAPARERPEITLEYHGDDTRTWCTATFPVERIGDVKSMVDRQIEFWEKGENDAH